uniref:Uncharacterized protein n=1 Tax=Arundo donax TaxID=35708 RepID=A0A0A8ZF97_ARUDO
MGMDSFLPISFFSSRLLTDS